MSDLDGMFAFALFDGDDFMLARDPIGIKPLYYGYVDGNLYFTSELGATNSPPGTTTRPKKGSSSTMKSRRSRSISSVISTRPAG